MDIGKIRYWNHSSKTKCVFVENLKSPLISIDIWCKSGISFEENDKRGVAHFLEHMIFKGSNKIMPGEFDYRIESLGGSSNASTGYDDAHYYVLIPPSNFKESLFLLTNLVLNPKIGSDEFRLEKEVVIEEIKQQNDQPEETLYNYFLKRVWRGHSYGNSILGNEKDIKNLNRFDLEIFHRKQYSRDNTCIAIAGNITHNTLEIVKECQLLYKEDYHCNKSNKTPKSANSIRIGREEIYFENLELSRIFMAWQIPSSDRQKFIIGFEILSSILTESRNSILTRPLKEENNLAESIYADVSSGEFGGLFILEVCCKTENLYRVENLINEILESLIKKETFIKEELKKAIRIIKSNYIFNLETSSQISSFFGNNLLWGRTYPLIELEQNIEYWLHIENFRIILNYLNKVKYTLIAHQK